MGRLVLWVVLTLALCATTASAQAPQTAQAQRTRAQVAAAFAAFSRNDLLTAERLIVRAYLGSSDERIFYGMGRIWEAAGRFLPAMYAYERFMLRVSAARRGEGPTQDAQAARVRLSRRLGRLVPQGPPSAWFQVDGGRRHTPRDGPIWVWPGERRLRSAAGERILVCPKGERVVVRIDAPAAAAPTDSDDEDDDDDSAARPAPPPTPRAQGLVSAEPPPAPGPWEDGLISAREGGYLLDALEAEPPPGLRFRADATTPEAEMDALVVPTVSRQRPGAGAVERPLGLVLSAAPMLRFRRLSIRGDAALPDRACYTLAAITPETATQPRAYRYQALPACPSQDTTTFGLGLSLDYYPLAAHKSRALAGLALHGALTLLAPSGAAGAGIESEIGLRWGWRDRISLIFDWRAVHAPLAAAPRTYPTSPTGEIVAGADGLPQGVVGVDARGLPSATYHSLALGAIFTVPYGSVRGMAVSSSFEARYLAMLSYGEIDDLIGTEPAFGGGYGAVDNGRGHGAFLQLTPLSLEVRPGLRVSAQVSYELYRMGFLVTEDARFLAPGATEDRVGAGLSLQYRR